MVLGITRKAGRDGLLKNSGRDHAIFDNGKVDEVWEIWPDGTDKILEVIGATNLMVFERCEG